MLRDMREPIRMSSFFPGLLADGDKQRLSAGDTLDMHSKDMASSALVVLAAMRNHAMYNQRHPWKRICLDGEIVHAWFVPADPATPLGDGVLYIARDTPPEVK